MPQCDVCDPTIRESLNFTLDTLKLQLSCPTASGDGARRRRGSTASGLGARADAVELEAGINLTSTRRLHLRGGCKAGPLTLNGDEGEGTPRARRRRTRPTPRGRAEGPTPSGN